MQQLHDRYCTLRDIAARVYRLADDSTVPSRSHAQSERMIDDAETIADDLRRVFR